MAIRNIISTREAYVVAFPSGAHSREVAGVETSGVEWSVLGKLLRSSSIHSIFY